MNQSNKITIPVAIAALVVLVVIGLLVFKSPLGTSLSPTQTAQTSPTADVQTFKDGTYEAVGNYVSPGGPREINLVITIENGVVVDTSFEGLAEDPTSIRFQKEFGDNYKSQVVGKSISGLALTKVSGSSLTPKGFNDALQKIKTQAQS